MPAINRRGDILGGFGTAHLSVNNAALYWHGPTTIYPLPPVQQVGERDADFSRRVNDARVIGGRGGWPTDDDIVFQVCDPVCRILRTNLPTGNTWEVLAGGSNMTTAGGGEFAAWRPADGVYISSLGRFVIGTGPGTTSADGAVAFPAVHQNGAPWDVFSKDGTLWRLTDSWIDDSTHGHQLHLLPGRKAVWARASALQSYQMPECKPVGSVGRPRAILVNGRWWIVYFSGELGVVAHPFDSTRGLVLVPPGQNAFAYDVAPGEDNTSFLFAYSSGAGEWPGEQQRLTVDTTKTYADLRPPVPTIVRIGRPMWLVWFTGSTANLPGNAYADVKATKFVHTMQGQPFWTYVAGNPDSDLGSLNQAIADAKKYGLPVVAYWTQRAQQVGLPEGADVVMVEAYRRVGESLAAFDARVRAAVARVPVAAVCCQCYTSNTDYDPDLQALPGIYSRIARDCTNVVGLFVFSGNGRPTGLQDHPEVRDEWEQVFAGIPGPPPVEVDVLNNPKVNIIKWEVIDADKTCQLVQFRNGGNPEHGLVTVELVNGSLHVKIENEAGADRSGLKRQVI